jgi:hypothetical protein
VIGGYVVARHVARHQPLKASRRHSGRSSIQQGESPSVALIRLSVLVLFASAVVLVISAIVVIRVSRFIIRVIRRHHSHV